MYNFYIKSYSNGYFDLMFSVLTNHEKEKKTDIRILYHSVSFFNFVKVKERS